jgi:hypothetical protein
LRRRDAKHYTDIFSRHDIIRRRQTYAIIICFHLRRDIIEILRRFFFSFHVAISRRRHYLPHFIIYCLSPYCRLPPLHFSFFAHASEVTPLLMPLTRQTLYVSRDVSINSLFHARATMFCRQLRRYFTPT